MEHKFVRFMNCGRGLNAHGRGGHIFPGCFVGVCLGVQVAKNNVAHFMHRHGAYGGRSGVGMSATPKSRADVAHINGFGSAAGHHLNAVVHKPYGEKHRKFFHFHQTVRQIGEIAQIMLHCGFRQRHLHVVDGIGLR